MIPPSPVFSTICKLQLHPKSQRDIGSFVLFIKFHPLLLENSGFRVVHYEFWKFVIIFDLIIMEVFIDLRREGRG
jgi:hypothetical protein